MQFTLPSGHVVRIDDDDAALLAGRRWYALKRKGHKAIYVRGQSPRSKKFVLLHSLIMGVPVDHWDGDGLNNCRRNLRPAGHRENAKNVGPKRGKALKGVTVDKGGRIRGTIMSDGVQIRSPRMPTEEAAARWYDAMARQHHGEWARLNFPDIVEAEEANTP